MTKTVSAALAVLCIVLPTVAAQAAVVETLPNGMTIAVEENHSAPLVSVRFYVRVGSAYEGSYLGAGSSHFVEHCVSEGTPTRSKQDIETLQESLGNSTNAYTSTDHTCYYITAPVARAHEAIELVADYVLQPSFPVDAVKTQRGIIEREITMGEDAPARRLWHLFSGTVYRTHPARYPTIGYREQFDLLQRSDLVSFHADHYVPENMVAVVVGDVDSAETLVYLRELLGRYPGGATRRPTLPAEPPQISARRQVEADAALNRAYLFIGWPTVDLYSPDLYALDVADFVLGYGPSSPLVTTLRDELGLVDDIGSFSHTPSYGTGVFAIRATLAPENLPAAEAAIIEQVRRLADEQVASEQLQKAITQKSAEIIYAQETIQGRAEILGQDLISTGDPDFSATYIRGIRQVTAADIRRVAAEYLRPETLNTAVLGPPEVAQAQQGTTAVTGSDSDRILSRRLDNGMLVLVQEAHHSPMVSMLAGFKAGVRYESEQTNGLSNFTAAMLVRGTHDHSYQQIAETTDGLAARLYPFSGRNTLGLQAQCTSDSFPQMLEVFADCLIHPTFPEDQLELQRQLILADISQREDNVNAVGMDLLAAELYRNHPYRLPQLGTAESVAALTREQLVEFHSRYLRPNGMVLSVIGDVSAEEAIGLVEERFADFSIGEIAPPAVSPEPEPTEDHLRRVARNQQQAIVLYGFPGPTIASPDRYTLDVLSAVLAGAPMPGGRLHEALRGAELVYATWAYPMAGIETGHYLIYAATAPERIAQTQEAIERVIGELASQAVADDELERGRSMAIAAKQLGIQAGLSRAQSMVLDELYGLGFDNYRHYADNITKVTAEQVQQLAAELLNFRCATIVITEPE